MAKKKSKTEKETAVKRKYRALTNLTNNDTGKEFGPDHQNKIVEDGDFPPAVIANWLEIDPPALEVES